MVITVYNNNNNYESFQTITFEDKSAVYNTTLNFNTDGQNNGEDKPIGSISLYWREVVSGSTWWRNESLILHKGCVVTIDNKEFYVNDKMDMCRLYKYFTGKDVEELTKHYMTENISQKIEKDFEWKTVNS